MLAELAVTFAQLFRLLGFCAMLIGVFFLLTAMLGARGADSYIKGGAFILVGGWIAKLGH